MRSWRGLSPKISSDRLTVPDSLPSSVGTFNSISRALLLGGLGFGRLALLRGRRSSRLCQPEFPRLGHILVQRLLHRATDGDPAALGARPRTLDQDQTTLDIGLHDLEIERGHSIDAHV